MKMCDSNVYFVLGLHRISFAATTFGAVASSFPAGFDGVGFLGLLLSSF